MSINFFGGFTIIWVLVLLLAFGILQWLNIPTGSFLDWVIGGASFWWLLVIVTVPWNIYFQSKEVVLEAEQSREKNIPVDDKQLNYVQGVAKRSLGIALGLHLLSAIVLYALAITGISAVGYIGSGAALLLTALRPVVRAYEYIAARLMMIRKAFTYPREDVVELRDRVANLEAQLEAIQENLDQNNPDSMVAMVQRQLSANRNDLTRLAASVEELRSHNQAEHDKLAKDARNAIAQLSEDSQVLEQVREIIRFFKSA
ncbi:hypothetical protein [Phormidium sp. CCY1219]|uniref:hypothetical protein n=1 Tax=Phormidium sp. CCY1219 TaxID=2886104 RepID=UPI002D1F63EF|nr:hypothetical protein [Phormidium sp. CCY1219]MEB3830899.1 hypothetical protein [Phormidium sp. CCY1219]